MYGLTVLKNLFILLLKKACMHNCTWVYNIGLQEFGSKQEKGKIYVVAVGLCIYCN